MVEVKLGQALLGRPLEREMTAQEIKTQRESFTSVEFTPGHFVAEQM
jgi:hypothetical protein